MGSSQGHISNIENGKKGFTSDFCIKLALALDLPVLTVLAKAGYIADAVAEDETQTRALSDTEIDNILWQLHVALSEIPSEQTKTAMDLLNSYAEVLKTYVDRSEKKTRKQTSA